MSGHEEREEHEEREAQEAPAAVPARESVGRRRLAAVAGSMVLAGALVAGVVVTAVTVRGADRDAGAPPWKFPQGKAEEKKATARPGLAGVLVPYGTGTWVRGPDLAEFGSDAQLSGAQTTALRKEALRGLPRTQRKQLERQIDRQRIKGMAMRSYFSYASHGYRNDEGISSVSIVLAQTENRAAVRRSSMLQNEFLDSSGLFRKGPKIKGYENARCFQAPEGDEEELDLMLCSAYVGDVLVSVTAYGAQPLDTAGIATLVRTQLDRIAEPGEAV